MDVRQLPKLPPEKLRILLDEERVRTGARIKVIGVGGAGCNALSHLAAEPLDGVAYAALNTDAPVLARASCAWPSGVERHCRPVPAIVTTSPVASVRPRRRWLTVSATTTS